MTARSFRKDLTPRTAWWSQPRVIGTTPRCAAGNLRLFDIGRDTQALGPSLNVGIYTAERSIIDAFRMRHAEGEDMANEALKRWLKRGGQPSELLSMARDFPRALPALRTTLAILL